MVDAAIWGFIGVVVGGIIAIGAEIIRGRSEASLDGAKRKDDRQLGRDHFQRETLLALQDATNASTIAASAVLGTRKAHFNLTGVWSGALPDDINQAEAAALVQLTTLRSRVADDQVRELARQLLVAVRGVGMAADEAAADASATEAFALARDLLERSGELIRATFVEH